MSDPYKVLGVSRSATDDEIKAAYRELAKKYHPDNYVDSNLSDLAEEKMKEVNEAYDTIRKEREGGGSSRAGYGGGAYGGCGGRYSGTGAFAHVRQLISAGRFSEAELTLDSMSSEDRGAEWHYLKGCVLLQRGAVYEAQRHIDMACNMDPSNAEYRSARDSMRYYAQGGGRQYRTAGSGTNDMCDLCSTLICMDCLCECCGGDLIACC